MLQDLVQRQAAQLCGQYKISNSIGNMWGKLFCVVVSVSTFFIYLISVKCKSFRLQDPVIRWAAELGGQVDSFIDCMWSINVQVFASGFLAVLVAL